MNKQNIKDRIEQIYDEIWEYHEHKLKNMGWERGDEIGDMTATGKEDIWYMLGKIDMLREMLRNEYRNENKMLEAKEIKEELEKGLDKVD